MARRVADYLVCPTCLEIFTDPVVLPCSHSFCRACVQQWWERKGHQSCPVCRTEFSLTDVPLNLALRNVCEAFSKASVEAEDVCSLHKEILKLFCLDHQELVCLVCRDAEKHAGHTFRPLDEVVKSNKEKLREGLQGAKERLEDLNEIRDDCNEQAAYIKIQTQRVESKIKKDFEELHRFLWVEEEARLSAVRDEEQKKSWRMKEKIEALDTDMAALSEAIRSAEEQLTSDPLSLMKNFQTAMTKIQNLPNKPELLPGALLDEAKHVGNLKFNAWERMKDMVSYSPVILDPNTADAELSLSEDLTSLSFGKRHLRPKNPERFDWYKVRGSALASGTHTWDVEVGESTYWRLGVAWGDPCLPNFMAAYGIGLFGGEYKGFADVSGAYIPSVKPQRIRVQVDTHERSISFSESLTNTQLGKTNPSAWSHLSDNMNLFPFFWTRSQIPLRIIPLAPRVTTQSQ
ncbi:tripartite motif-containing protein 35-like isoform X1 [Hippocampus comes]|uniref:tripartite motif-containing protein 35-like isoform X1 n=1 Tax=Hippocampus comes TaxID=109280 RepID=UPI00094E027F|nr:PREDICTED: tripartite motif-containing protein 35-like isoform X1 [Hippocampus comes]XP_019731268.1 PREDICTED: tripartite motif-containing protein 35-like isoform X1 [Hippocampus comes]